jgi:hypothetical protein
LLARLGARGRQAVSALFDDPDPRLAIVAARALFAAGEAAEPLAARLADDASPLARREAASLLRPASVPEMRREEGAEEQRLRAELLASYTAGDRTLLEALGLMVEGREDVAARAVLGADDIDPLAWSPAQTELLWRLHRPEQVPAWTARAMSAALPVEAREQALAALAFTPGP